MANYSLVSNAKFNRMTLQEMLTPLMMYEEAASKYDSKLEELEDNTAVLERMLAQNPESTSAKIYKEFSNTLKALSTDFSDNGLSIENNKRLRNLRTRFKRDIDPIIKADTAYKEFIKAQNEDWRRSNGQLRYSVNANDLTVDDFLYGKSPQYLQLNLNDLFKETATGVAAIASNYFGEPEIKELNRKYDEIIRSNGVTPEEALAELEQENGKFYDLINTIKERYNTSAYKSSEKEINATIREAIFNGATKKTEYAVQGNPNFESDASYLNRIFQYQKEGVKVNDSGTGFVVDEAAPTFRSPSNNDLYYDSDGNEFTYSKSTGRYIRVSDPTISYSKEEWNAMQSSSSSAQEVENRTKVYAFSKDWASSGIHAIDTDDSGTPDEYDRALLAANGGTYDNREYQVLGTQEAAEFWTSDFGKQVAKKYNIKPSQQKNFKVIFNKRGAFFDDQYIIAHKDFDAQTYWAVNNHQDYIDRYNKRVQEAGQAKKESSELKDINELKN